MIYETSSIHELRTIPEAFNKTSTGSQSWPWMATDKQWRSQANREHDMMWQDESYRNDCIEREAALRESRRGNDFYNY